MRYDFDEIEFCANAIKQASTNAGSAITELSTKLSTLLAGWDADGHLEYVQAEATWQACHKRLEEINMQIALQVEKANLAMRESDGGIAKNFRDYSPSETLA